MSKTTLPWEFSFPPEEGEQAIANLPSLEGALLGREIARLAEAAEAKQREHFPDMLPRCDDCAARLGTTPNQSVSTLMDLVKCAVECVPFYCHKGIKEGEDGKRLCTGFVVLMADTNEGQSHD